MMSKAKGSHYFHAVSCPLSHDPQRGWGQGPCSVQVASPHKVFVTF